MTIPPGQFRLLVLFVAIAYLGLVLVATAGFYLNAQAVKKATLQAAAVQRCLGGRLFLKRQYALEQLVLTQEQLDSLPPAFPIPTVKQCKEAR